MFVSGYPSIDVAPSHISDDTVSHFDYGLLFGGGSTMNFTNDVVSSDTTTCYRDTSTSGTAALRGQFDGIWCGGTVNRHDGVGLGLSVDWGQQRYMNGGLELGVPGISSPGGLTGYGTLRDVEKAMAAGFTLHLRKPIDLQALIDAVSQAVH